MKNVLNEIYFRILYGLAYLVSLLPYSVLYAFSFLSYIFVYNIFGYRKTVVIQNISRSFPSKNYDDIKNISKDFYRKFVDHFVEILKLRSVSPRKLARRVQFVNFDIIKKYLAEGRKVIVGVGHCGNWEMFNILPYSESLEMYVVYKPLRNKIQDRIMFRLRTRFGVKMIPAKQIGRHILKNKGIPQAYFLIGDQCPSRVDETYRMTFLNQSSAMFPGIEKLSIACDAVVTYLNITQKKRGYYKVECILLTEKPKTMKETEITRRYADLLEANIKQEPSGWLWTHKRWKR